MMNSRLKTQIQSAFKLRGFQIRLDAVKYLSETLGSALQDENETEAWIENVLDAMAKKNLETVVVAKAVVEEVVKELSNRESGNNSTEILRIIDAFEVPKFSYSEERKKFLPDSALGKDPPKLYSDAEGRIGIFRTRYDVIKQRTSRHHLFNSSAAKSAAASQSPSSSAVLGDISNSETKRYHLKTVEFLLGTTDKLDDVIVLGMLIQVKQGKFSLEDPTGAVPLDLSEAKFHTGLYTENCFVLVEGCYEERTLHVTAVGFPPLENSDVSRTFFGNADSFGGGAEIAGSTEINPRKCDRLKKLEAEQSDSMFVFLSDVWLDHPDVMTKLAKLFAGYHAVPPTAFVLMGNFLSTVEPGAQHAKTLKERFRVLADMIADFPDLVEQSKFVFIPGPSDPGFTNIFPRPALPKCLAEDLVKKVPGAILASNPCRIRFCTQEIVLFREDIVTKMCRNCVYFPQSGEIPSHFARTILSQSHLTPMTQHICPVYWDHDRAMHLYPAPDLVIVGDKFDPFSVEQIGCKIVNPGSFAKTDFSFKTFVPATKEVEESQIPADDE